jgi:hypothetical protein
VADAIAQGEPDGDERDNMARTASTANTTVQLTSPSSSMNPNVPIWRLATRERLAPRKERTTSPAIVKWRTPLSFPADRTPSSGALSINHPDVNRA